METFFFIPATKLHKIYDIQKILSREIIIDFEDSISAEKVDLLLTQITSLSEFTLFWYRVPTRNSFDESICFDNILKFLNKGVSKIVVPKLKTYEEYKDLLTKIKNLKNKTIIILLIEHPRLLLELKKILCNDTDSYIYALGIGSHDLTALLNARHNAETIYFPRITALYHAKAYNKKIIDIASMNIKDKSSYLKELEFGETHGFDGKFLVHPIQLEWFLEYFTKTDNEENWAKKIISALPENFDINTIEPFILDGEIIEKPHVIKALNFFKKNHENK